MVNAAINAEDSMEDEDLASQPLLEEGRRVEDQPALAVGSMSTSYLAGIIQTADVMRLRRLVFRSARGNALVQIRHLDGVSELGSEK